MTLFPRVLELLRARGGGDILLTGGGIIPEADMEALQRIGVGRLFGPVMVIWFSVLGLLGAMNLLDEDHRDVAGARPVDGVACPGHALGVAGHVVDRSDLLLHEGRCQDIDDDQRGPALDQLSLRAARIGDGVSPLP